MSDERVIPNCAYCGLPVGPGILKRTPRLQAVAAGTVDPAADHGQASHAYCCFGCRFAASVAAENGEEGQVRWTLTRLGWSIFLSMNVMVFTLAMWSHDVYADEALQSDRSILFQELFRYLSLLFTVPVLFLLGGPMLLSAGEELRRKRITTDLLIVMGVSAAFIYSVISVVFGNAHVYFEVACTVLVAVTLGRWLEAAGKHKATKALRGLEALLPREVRVVEPIGDSGTIENAADIASAKEYSLPLEQLAVGQLVRVLPGERIPVDGVVRRGLASIDQQLVTGESDPVVKEPGNELFAGTLNTDGDLLVEVCRSPRAGALQRIVDAVERAAMSKGRLQNLADRIVGWFVPVVILLAVGTFWLHGLSAGWGAGLMASLAVLLIACPCALGIATPMAIHAAIGCAARHGVLFRTGDVIERLASSQCVGFDKTGTLTTGTPLVERFVADEESDRDETLRVATVMASASRHLLSTAMRRFGEVELGPQPFPVLQQPQTVPGLGIRAYLAGTGDLCYLGSPRFMDQSGQVCSARMEQVLAAARGARSPVACVGWRGRVRAVFVFREQLREGAEQVLQSLRHRGLAVVVLTGDQETQVVATVRLFGAKVETEQLPDDKLTAMDTLRRKHGPVVMVGDGINDAPALAHADIGIALGCGADVSREAADLCLLGDDLRQIPWAIDLAQATVRTMYHNLSWAFAYNCAGIALAITGWLNPIWASVAMVGSSLLVVTNSLRLAADFGPRSEAQLVPKNVESATTAPSPIPAFGPVHQTAIG